MNPLSTTLSLLLTSSVLVCVQSFVVKLYLVQHPRTVQETEDITCWTCPGKSDNEECNDWAPDRQCRVGHSWCKTVHRFNMHTGRSILVNKECTRPEHCTADHVGCARTIHHGVIDCTSCCNQDYCNEYVANNHTHAIQLSSYTLLNTATTSSCTTLVIVLCLGLISLLRLVWS